MFLLVWTVESFDEMNEVVRANPSRTAELAAALQEMTDVLSRNPTLAGESRWGDLRVIFPRPLTVYFRPDVAARTVDIAQIRLTS